MITVGIFFVWTSTCKAWQPPKREDEAAFLKWYEENKDRDGAYYRLKGELYLTRGEPSRPICFDGEGEVTIDCGEYGILVDSYVTLDNPKMQITGENFFLFMVRSSGVLTLKQGTIDYGTQDGVAVDVRNGKLRSPESSGGMRILAHGSNVTGIYYALTEETTLSNLIISVDGSGTAKGIDAAFRGNLHVDNCRIQVSGGTEAYGVCAEYGPDIFVRDSLIRSDIKDTGGRAYSVYSDGGSIKYKDSELKPALPEGPVYQIMETKAGRPVYVEAQMTASDWPLPERVETHVQVENTGKEEVIALPVVWQLPEQAVGEAGYCTVKGQFDTGELYEEILNPNQIIPEITVLCLPQEKMFLIAYETFPDEGRKGVQLLVPYPYDADRLMVEYSVDGQNFTRYAPHGDSNILVEGETIRKDGMYSFYIDVTVPEEGIYIRTVVEGDSIFAGRSGVWKVERKNDGGIPGNTGGDSSGDRGGQDTEVVFPQNEYSESGSGKGREGTAGNAGEDDHTDKAVNKKREEPAVDHDSKDTKTYIPASGSVKERSDSGTGADEKNKADKNKIWIALGIVTVILAAGVWAGMHLFHSKRD